MKKFQAPNSKFQKNLKSQISSSLRRSLIFGVWIFFGAWCLVLGACTPASRNHQTVDLVSPDGETVSFQVEVADDPFERAQGLMFRDDLPDGQGMLFVFEDEQPLNFWMKNTLIPLDIIFFDKEGQFVSWDTMVPCTGDHCPMYGSEWPAKVAVEVPFGTIKREGIGEGWVLAY